MSASRDQVTFSPGITVFVTIQVNDHSIRDLTRFATEIAAMDEVMDCYRMAGDDDYILRVVVLNTPAFDEFFKRLIEIIPLKNVTSRFALANIKYESGVSDRRRTDGGKTAARLSGDREKIAPG